MHKTYKRLAALGLSLLLALGLTACGSDGEKDADTQRSGTVYVPRFMDLGIDLGKTGRVSQGCTDGKSVYVLTAVYPDWEAGEDGDTRYEIYRVPLDGGSPEKLENFQLPPTPEGYDTAYVYANNLRAGAEGTLWVGVSVNAAKYDLPEDFDPDSGYMWEYNLLEELDAEYQVQLDSTGNEIARVDTSGLREKAGVDYLYSDGMLFDRDGDMYVGTQGKIIVLDPSLNVRFTLEEESFWGDGMVLLSDGTVGVRMSVRDVTNDTYNLQLRVIDKAAKNWSTTNYPLPGNAYQIYSGGGDYLFYYKDGEDVYGVAAEAGEGEKLFNWLESDVNSDEVEFFSFLPDGRVVAMTRSWTMSGSNRNQLVLLTATDRSEVPEKTVLTYATMYLGQDERVRILDFNKNNPTYRIEVTDYSQFNTDEDYRAGVQKLNTEIIAGTVPDIINLSAGLPLRQYGAKGYLEDLWPYIEGDADLGRGALMERVFAAAEQDGKLYQVFDTFSIATVLGAESVVGQRMSWTLADLQEALSTMPEGCSIFGQYDTKDSMLSNVVMMNLDSFVDWDGGTCSFDSPGFKSLLAFCDSFPAEVDHDNSEYDDDPTRVAEGRQMLLDETLTNFQDIQMSKAVFGGPVSYVGYPMEDGGVGSSFYIYGGLAMSSTCKDKDGAWSFLREILLPRYAGNEDAEMRGMGNFPTNRADFEWFAQQSMTPSGFETDADGNPVLDEDGNPIETSNSGWGWGSVQIDVFATKQEEYDQIMALYNAVERMASSDENIMEIVSDVAGSYFAGDRSLDDAADLIQNRATTYINEQR